MKKVKVGTGVVAAIVTAVTIMELMLLSIFQGIFGAQLDKTMLITGVLTTALPLISSLMLILTAERYSKADFAEVVMLGIAGASMFMVKNSPFVFGQGVSIILAIILIIGILFWLKGEKKNETADAVSEDNDERNITPKKLS